MSLSRVLGIVVVILSVKFASAGAFTAFEEAREREALGVKENCGPQPEAPGLLGSIFNGSQKKAVDNYYLCLERNKRRDYLKGKGESQAIVDRTRESCQNSIRRLSSNPSTLSFNYGKEFDYLSGLNGSGVDTTDGGYSVKVSGSDIRGQFYVTCYMDKSFNITNVR